MKKRSRRSLHILITAGPTREYLDSIRYISNPSSGKMGYALARAAAQRGHRVTLVSGPVNLPEPSGVKTIQVETGEEMLRASKNAFTTADAAIFAAAVCDYRPAIRTSRKAPKLKRLKINLVATKDIAATLGRSKGKQITIAFALEDHNGRSKAEAKLHAKRADAIILNSPANIGRAHARVDFLARGDKWNRWPMGTKRAISSRIVTYVEEANQRRHRPNAPALEYAMTRRRSDR
ncbi:MAG TPA: phosphopantothenoylcysteine decarboxylase [Phycisphaerae bacterium]|nr:phosphopantothenoylcysteine decarboxylase [Phycisphaerae bacterium]